MWMGLRDERPWGSAVPPAALYRYAEDWKKMRPEELLRGWRGYLHVDGHSGCNAVYGSNPVARVASLLTVGCWARARKEIVKVHYAEQSPRTRELVDHIGTLFAIEQEIAGCHAEKRLTVRQQQAVSLLAALKASFDKTLEEVSGKGNLADAVRCTMSRWESFTRYTTDGRLEICNHAAERLRPIAERLRPNVNDDFHWTFADSDSDGEHAAIIYTLIETARLNRVNPEDYLRRVIARFTDHPAQSIADLLPWNIE
jgi:transposase